MRGSKIRKNGRIWIDEDDPTPHQKKEETTKMQYQVASEEEVGESAKVQKKTTNKKTL